MTTRQHAVTWALIASGLLLCAGPVGAQVPVIDVANLLEISDILLRAEDEVATLSEQVGHLTKMAARLQGMDRFRTPPIVPVAPNPSLFPWARTFIEALTTGDPRDELYRHSIQHLPELGPLLDALQLPAHARRGIEAQYGTLQIYDTVIPRAVHQTAIIRGFRALDQALEALADDVTSPRNATHYLTATMAKVAGGLLIQNRQAANGIQIASGTLEQAIAMNTMRRNDAASAMNFTLGVLEDGGRAAHAQISGASDALARWTLR